MTDDDFAAYVAARFPARAPDAPTHRDEECAASSRAYEAELTALRRKLADAEMVARGCAGKATEYERERDESAELVRQMRSELAEAHERVRIYERLLNASARALMEQGDRLPAPTGFVHARGKQ